MAHELGQDEQLVRHRGALLDGQEPRRLLPLVIPGCRSARGRRARHAECTSVHLRDGCHRIPRAGFRDCALRSLSLGRSLRPIMGPLSSVARFGPRARARSIVALPRDAWERSFLETRALYITSLCTPAPGDPAFRLRRGPAGRPAAHERAWHSPRSTPTTGGEARARPTPRHAGPAAGHELSSRAHELSSKGVELLPKAGQPQPSPRAGARRAPCAHGRPRDGPTSAEAKPRRGGGRRREPAHVRAHAAGAVPAPVRRGAVGPAEARRSHKPTADKPASASRSNARSAARLHRSPGLVCCIARLNGGARLREAAARPPAVAPEPDPQERRRDVARAPVLARARATWRPPLP